MILIDFQQVVIACSYAFQADMQKGRDTKKMHDILRHSFLTSVLGYKKNFGKKYGEIVFCCEGGRSWRKDVYKQYKASRNKGREESTTDWDSIFEFINELKVDLKTTFPWRLVEVKSAEGDDVIATLTEYTQENLLIQEGLVEDRQKVMIVSSDGDFKQLHVYGNVEQFNPILKKKVDKPEKDFLIEKIIHGDPGDGVPSVLCADDWFTRDEKTRAKPITKKVIDKFKDGLGLTDEEKLNYQRNSVMISFEYIPEELKKSIIAEYHAQQPKTDLNAIMNYLMKKRAKLLLERLQDFK